MAHFDPLATGCEKPVWVSPQSKASCALAVLGCSLNFLGAVYNAYGRRQEPSCSYRNNNSAPREVGSEAVLFPGHMKSIWTGCWPL